MKNPQFLEKHLVLKRYKKKSILIDNNIGGDLFFLVKKGIARSFVRNENDKEFTKTLYTEGMHIGSVERVAKNKESRIMFDCLTQCELYVGNYKELLKLSESNLELSKQYNRLLENLYLRLEERIFELTLTGKEKYSLLKEQIPNIEMLIPQYQIASYLNVTNIQLSRIKKDLLFSSK